MTKELQSKDRFAEPASLDRLGGETGESHGNGIAQPKPWERLSRQWSLLGPPLRPSLEDMQRFHNAWLASLPVGVPDRKIDILLLGVTPEVTRFPWAPSVSLTAIDCCEPMLQAVWPGDGPDQRAVLGNWLRTPFADASFDLAITDAGLVVLNGLEEHRALSRELRRVLRPNGRALIRHFTRPVQLEQPEAVLQAVNAGQIRNFNELKLRLLLALPGEGPDRQVRLTAALECFNQLFPNRPALASQLGCTLEILSTIDTYQGRMDRYTFASAMEIAQCFQEFSMATGPRGQYPLADCCPVFSFTPKS
jgi:SAM-dependent methyltransferase